MEGVPDLNDHIGVDIYYQIYMKCLFCSGLDKSISQVHEHTEAHVRQMNNKTAEF